MKVIATQAFRYGGKDYPVNAEIDMPAKHARIFTATRHVTAADGMPDDDSGATAPKPLRRRGRYRRRDMRADASDGDGA